MTGIGMKRDPSQPRKPMNRGGGILEAVGTNEVQREHEARQGEPWLLPAEEAFSSGIP